MSAHGADPTPSRPRPRPGPRPAEQQNTPSTAQRTTAQQRARSTRAARGRRSRSGGTIALPDQRQAVAVAGNAIVTAARVGRLLGRSGMRLARQVPGVSVVEQQAQRLRTTAITELGRVLDNPQFPFGAATDDEQRAMMLVHGAGSDPAPLRTAMTELLDRASEASDTQSRDYLFGTIVSQLVPDEARILAALAAGRPYAAVDIVTKVGRTASRTLLANASTVGSAAGVSLPQNVGTYLTRLHGYGLVEFGPADSALARQLDALAADATVAAARRRVDVGRQGSSRLVPKSVQLSPLGREFWAASAPPRPRIGRRTS